MDQPQIDPEATLEELNGEISQPEDLVFFLDSVYKDKSQKIGTRTQAASTLLQWWFMVETAAVANQFIPQNGPAWDPGVDPATAPGTPEYAAAHPEEHAHPVEPMPIVGGGGMNHGMDGD